jgi:glucose-6-phosphate 1-epimerase
MRPTNLSVLQARFGSPAVSFQNGPDGAPVLRLVSAQAEAHLALYGGQLMRFGSHGAEPWLWNAAEQNNQPDTSLRGGVPLCFPWFAKLRPNADRVRFPFHGFARLSLWEILETNGSGVRLRLPPHGDWPLETRLQVSFSNVLDIELSVENVGRSPVRFEAALHPYLAVRELSSVWIEGLDGATYLNQSDGLKPSCQQGPVRFAGEVNHRFVETTAELRLCDPVAGRAFRLRKRGSRTTVVWNPWTHPVDGYGPEEYRRFVCIEPACIGADAVALEPGAVHRLGVEISCEPLEGDVSPGR